MAKLCGICGPPGNQEELEYQPPPSDPRWPPPGLATPTCMRFTIISCSTRGCISPVRFMVPSSKMSAWTVGKPVLCSCSECTDSMLGMLRRHTPGQRQGQQTRGETAENRPRSPSSHLLQKPDLLMSVPQCSAWLRSWGLLRLARISPSFKRECSMAVQEAGGEKARWKLLGRRDRAWPIVVLPTVLPGPWKRTARIL